MRITTLTRRFLLWFVVVALLPLSLFGVLTLLERKRWDACRAWRIAGCC
jgi:hypothetical protein